MRTPDDVIHSLMSRPHPEPVMWAGFVAPVLRGELPHVRYKRIRYIERIEDLVPIDTIVATADNYTEYMVRAEADGAGWLLTRNRNDSTGEAWIAAADREAADKTKADLISRLPEPPARPQSTDLDFWHVDADGDPFYKTRAIDAPDWPTLATCYPAPVIGALEALRTHDPTPEAGRIILWHGPPGTGKTSAIRALARSWTGRIRVQVLLDPDRVLANASTLMSLLLSNSRPRWRLLVIEDADELLRVDAKDRVGQSLSRLLNLSDGLLGQGTKVLVLITTNEPIGRIHPALIRPGRCLAETEFRHFTRAEARRWADGRVDGSLPAGSSFSLAELSALADGKPIASTDQAVGLYL